jgi:hypothetical protein
LNESAEGTSAEPVVILNLLLLVESAVTLAVPFVSPIALAVLSSAFARS